MAVPDRLTSIFGRRRFAIKPGLERISGLLSRLGHPERSFSTIHVVGTNGKGSTASFLAAILAATGCTTGLFTSPHLIDYCERFQINGKQIPPENLDRLIDQVLAVATPDDTFFELTTAIACCHFARNGVRVAVMEAGMGGRSDATAAIAGLCTLITPISLDHCQWLGDSLEAISFEKCAIAEPGSSIISAHQKQAVHTVIENYCRENGNHLLVSGHDFQATRGPDATIRYRDEAVQLDALVPGIPGRYQTENAAVAIAAARCVSEKLRLDLDTAHIRYGLSAAKWPGRMESVTLGNGVRLLLDGAHNPAGALALADALSDYARRRIILLIGMMEDKDLDGILGPLMAQAEVIHTVAPAQERAIPAVTLAQYCSDRGNAATPHDTVAAGLMAVCNTAGPEDLIVVAGSLFTVGETKAALSGIDCDAVRG